MIRESPEIRRDRDTEIGGRKDQKVQHKKSNTQIIGALKTWNRKTGGGNHQQNNFRKFPTIKEPQFPD